MGNLLMQVTGSPESASQRSTALRTAICGCFAFQPKAISVAVELRSGPSPGNWVVTSSGSSARCSPPAIPISRSISTISGIHCIFWNQYG